MDKGLIIRFIDGDCTDREKEQVLSWIDADTRNKAYFEDLRNLIIKTKLASYDTAIAESSAKAPKEKKSRLGRIARLALASAAALALIVSVLSNLYLAGKVRDARENPLEVLKVLDGESLRDMRSIVYHTEKGVRSRVVLPDGSVVVLNSDSRLTVPESFSGNYRECDFSGEAYFDVVPNKDFPMIVSTANGVIEVLGTKFNLRSYASDGATSATLISGKIKIKAAGDKYSDRYMMELKPKETAILRDGRAIKHIVNADTVRATAWKDGRLIFDATPMSQVISELERWHGCNFVVRDSSVLNYNITAKFESKSVLEIMDMIRFCSPVDFRMANDTVYLKISRK